MMGGLRRLALGGGPSILNGTSVAVCENGCSDPSLDGESGLERRGAAVGAEASLTAVGEVGAVGEPTVAAVGAGITADALVDTAVSAIAAAVG